MMNAASPSRSGLSQRRHQSAEDYNRRSSSGSYNEATSPSPGNHRRQSYGDNGDYSYNQQGQYYNQQQQQQHYSSHHYAQSQAHSPQPSYASTNKPHQNPPYPPHSSSKNRQSQPSSSSWSFKSLDLFPKVERDLSIQTKQGGVTTLLGYLFVILFVWIEIASWNGQNRGTKEHVMVHTRLEKELHVSLNITFPSVACSDLVIESIDIGGDSTLITSLNLVRLRQSDGSPMNQNEIKSADKIFRKEQREYEVQWKQHAIKSVKVEMAGYCGSCYGAHEIENQCCNTCQDVILAYKKKGWSDRELRKSAEQCVDDGSGGGEEKDAQVEQKEEEEPAKPPRRLRKNEGCNIHGNVNVNRVGGIFHFHINTGSDINWMEHKTSIELSEDATKFDASHVVHDLNFGPIYDGMDFRGMEGVKKDMSDESGTGLFMYYVQLVPTTYKGEDMVQLLGEPVNQNFNKNNRQRNNELLGDNGRSAVDTIQYFYTEQFQPFTIDMMDSDNDAADSQEEEEGGKKGRQASLERIQQIILPGVFFQYELYPFSVEITKNSSPLLHLTIKLMATVGGVVTIVGWVQALFYRDDKKRSMFPK